MLPNGLKPSVTMQFGREAITCLPIADMRLRHCIEPFIARFVVAPPIKIPERFRMILSTRFSATRFPRHIYVTQADP